MEDAGNYALQTADLVNNSMTGLVGNISDALAGNKVDWDNWASSVLQSMQKILLNAMLVDSLKSMSGSSGMFGSLVSGVTGYFGGSSGASTSVSSGTALQEYAANFKFNALGGVYDTPSLSAYSNGVYSTPQTFAFAKGAGVFGEAGPEAIMPLTRASNGSLGVRMDDTRNQPSASGSTVIHQNFSISGNGDVALKQAMQDAARQGALDGAKLARQELLQDFQTRGQARRLLNV